MFLAKRIPELAKQPDAIPTAETVRSVFHVVIWAPYFLLSKQGQALFTR